MPSIALVSNVENVGKNEIMWVFETTIYMLSFWTTLKQRSRYSTIILVDVTMALHIRSTPRSTARRPWGTAATTWKHRLQHIVQGLATQAPSLREICQSTIYKMWKGIPMSMYSSLKDHVKVTKNSAQVNSEILAWEVWRQQKCENERPNNCSILWDQCE